MAQSMRVGYVWVHKALLGFGCARISVGRRLSKNGFRDVRHTDANKYVERTLDARSLTHTHTHTILYSRSNQ